MAPVGALRNNRSLMIFIVSALFLIFLVSYFVLVKDKKAASSFKSNEWSLSGDAELFMIDIDTASSEKTIKIKSLNGQVTEKNVINLIKFLPSSSLNGTKSLHINFQYRSKNEKDGFAFIGCDIREVPNQKRTIIDTLEQTEVWRKSSFQVEGLKPSHRFVFAIGILGAGEVEFSNIELVTDSGIKGHFLNEDIASNEIDFLRDKVIPLDFEKIEPSSLLQFEQMIGNAKIVGLGEGTHGTKEFVLDRLDILKVLVEKGFNVFCMETDLPISLAINKYLDGESDDISGELNSSVHIVMKNQEVIKTLNWIRDYNRVNRKNKIRFYGYDIKGKELASYYLWQFAQKHKNTALLSGIEEIKKIEKMIEDDFKDKEQNTQTVNEENFKMLSEKARELDSILQSNSFKLAKENDSEEYAWVLQNAAILYQYGYALSHVNNLQVYNPIRDSLMYRNILWIQARNPQSRMIITGHNGHIHKTAGNTGGFLKQRFGDEYLAIGYSTFQGSYSAQEGGGINSGFTLNQPGNEAYEYSLHQTKIPSFFIDLRDPDFYTKENGVNRIKMFRSIGAMPMDQQFFYTYLPGEFDIIRYIDKTTSTGILK